MHISRLRLRNFRNFRNAEFQFAKGVNTLIGENGSGKTNVFHAIRLLLDDSLSRGAIRLRETDFNRALGPWRGHWIIISLEFEELDDSEGCQMMKQNIGHMDGTEIGTYTLYFRPNKAVRKSLHQITEDGGTAEETQALLNDITIDQYEACLTGRSPVDITDDAIYSQLVGDFAILDFPNPDEDDAAVLGDRVQQPLHAEVSCTFIKALRDVVSELRNYRDSPLLNLLRGTEKKIELAEAEGLLEKIRTLNSDIAALDEIRNISKGIQDTLQDTVGHTYSPGIDIRSSIPEEIDKVLQRLCLTVSDPGDEGYRGEIEEMSLGGANLIYLSLKLLEYELKTATDRVAHFLLIEEPESHIHTHIQKTLFEKYDYEQTQVVVSTHSTHISAASRIRSVNILAKGEREAFVFHPSHDLDDDKCARIERYLDAVRTTLLFAKGVILVEGDAEVIIIPALVRKVLGVSLDELGVSLINMSSAVFANLAVMFHDDRIRRRCAIITDLDESIVALPDTEEDDDTFQARCRSSQTSGEQRKQLLDQSCEGNEWCKPFYAVHTFEVDFLMAGNAYEAVEAMNELVRVPARRARSEQKLNDADVAVAGREILRLAESKGKGWFALILAEKLIPGTFIPEYIRDAIAFACEKTITRQSLVKMVAYRCAELHDDSPDRRAVLRKLNNGAVDEILDEYKERYPADELSAFAELVR